VRSQRSWAKGGFEVSNGSSIQALNLRIVELSYTNDNNQIVVYEKVPLQIAVIIPKRPCFQLLELPNIAPEVWAFIQNILNSCVSVRVIKSKKLQWRKFKSLLLLYMDPPVLFIDGSDQVVIHLVFSFDCQLTCVAAPCRPKLRPSFRPGRSAVPSCGRRICG